MFNFYVSIAVLMIGSANAVTQVKQCKPLMAGQVIPPAEVSVGECVNAPCSFPRGTETIITMTFTAMDDFQRIVLSFYATMGSIKQGYPGIDGKDGCDKLYLMPDKVKTSCPIEKGKTYMFELGVPVKSSFPKVTVPYHLGLKDKSSKREAACMESVIKIV